MKPFNALIVSATCLTLGACAISIGDDDYDGNHYGNDAVTVTLPSGDTSHFRCPDELNIFVVDGTNEGRGLIYGCRSRGVSVPVID